MKDCSLKFIGLFVGGGGVIEAMPLENGEMNMRNEYSMFNLLKTK
jgi:hypothetical protein